MTISISRIVTSKATKASFNGETITIASQSPITEKMIDAAINAYSQRENKPQYAMCRWVDNVSDKYGAAIVKLPDNFTGVSNEIEDENFEVIGTLMKKGRTWYVETNEETVELIRRKEWLEKMKKGLASVGGFGNDHKAYREYLTEKDTIAGKVITRGHGLDVG